MRPETGNRKSIAGKILFLLLVISGLWLQHSARADNLPGGDRRQPVEINANETLEWHRQQQRYIGHGHVVAKQGESMIEADTITADYRSDATSKNDIYRITAVGHVILTSSENRAVGDHAVYNLDSGIAVLTGRHLKMTAPNQVVTARDNFTYDANDDRVDANGLARAERTMNNGDIDIITADHLSAWFPQDEFTGERALDHMEARNHVVITTPTNTLYGDRGDYRTGDRFATVTGHAKLQHGADVLTGDHGQVDLNTNISRMVGAKGTTQGVHGVFYPNDHDPDDTKPATFLKKPVPGPAPKPLVPLGPSAPSRVH